jgi:hypothetical protein
MPARLTRRGNATDPQAKAGVRKPSVDETAVARCALWGFEGRRRQACAEGGRWRVWADAATVHARVDMDAVYLCRMKILAPFATTVRELGELRCYRSRTSVKSEQSGGVTWEPWS